VVNEIFQSTGTYHYFNHWLILECDEELARYYRQLVHLYYRSIVLQKPMHGSHITIIAGKYENAPYRQYWKKYDGQQVKFEYDPHINTDNEYFWLTVNCKEFENVRVELGLNPIIPIPWHLTIGNLK
jgi:hypothetical protein